MVFISIKMRKYNLLISISKILLYFIVKIYNFKTFTIKIKTIKTHRK